MAPTMQTDGYLIVLKPAQVIEQYSQSEIAIRNSQAMAELRQAFKDFDPKRYRGVSRFPLIPYPSLEKKVIDEFQKSGSGMKTDARARYRFCEIVGETVDDEDFDSDLLPAAANAKEVLSLLDDPEKWEIIRVSRFSEGTDDALGYDVAYWGDDHFSLIADTIVIPQWHPPDTNDFPKLRAAISKLNSHLLFESAHTAEEFRSYYKSRPWAETEDPEGQFCVIRVEALA